MLTGKKILIHDVKTFSHQPMIKAMFTYCQNIQKKNGNSITLMFYYRKLTIAWQKKKKI